MLTLIIKRRRNIKICCLKEWKQQKRVEFENLKEENNKWWGPQKEWSLKRETRSRLTGLLSSNGPPSPLLTILFLFFRYCITTYNIYNSLSLSSLSLVKSFTPVTNISLRFKYKIMNIDYKNVEGHWFSKGIYYVWYYYICILNTYKFWSFPNLSWKWTRKNHKEGYFTTNGNWFESHKYFWNWDIWQCYDCEFLILHLLAW